MPPEKPPVGDTAREAIDSLRGYVYQIYQSALAWTELKEGEFLFLEVAEDYAVAAQNALKAVQVKETAGSVTINSVDIVASIDSFVELRERNLDMNVTLRHLTTSTIGKEKNVDDRVDGLPTLDAWRKLAKAGDLTDLRRVLAKSKLSKKSKGFVENLDDTDLRENFLKKIHFDCGAIESRFLSRQILSIVSRLIIDRGGVHSQAKSCADSIMMAVLKLSTNPNREERFIDRNQLEEILEATTRVSLNMAQFEVHNQNISKALSTSVPSGLDFSSADLVRPSPIFETPLPKALANREEAIGQIQKTLDAFGVCWISGAAGMGKTVAARILAHRNRGDWASINLRGKSREQVAQILVQSADSMKGFALQGLIVDDLGHATDPSVLDSLCYLFFSTQRSDVLLILNSSDRPNSEFIFTSDLHAGVEHTLSEFSEKDIQEILEKCGVKDTHWATYAHLVSGGGHPQLAMAFIQSMTASGWNPSEFQTLDALLQGSPAVEDVRKRTRERLLNDLPPSSRQLIERLSLQMGGFTRELAVDLGKIEPSIQDAGIILETLIGSWVDQQEGNRFSLSPLLSGFAAKTLGLDDKRKIQSAIAVSLTKGRSLNVTDMNSAFLAAWTSDNEGVLWKICIAILGSDFSELEMIAPHLSMFTMFRTDKIAYPANAALSHTFRGAQVLLLNQVSDSPHKLQDALRCFAEEATAVEHDTVRSAMNLLIYAKLMLQNSKAGLGVNFIGILSELHHLLESDSFSDDVLAGMRAVEKEGVTATGLMFINQVRQLTKVEDLRIVFDFLDAASSDLRSRLLATFSHDDFEVDMLVAGPWLREHDQGTIDAPVHSATFARLEEQSVSWGETDLAVCCRKYQAIILDEYGNDKDGALLVLDDGLSKFGQTNSELVREKAKVLYRSDDYKGSLELSKALIEGNAPLNEIEKAFLGRDAAISAEKQGDFKTARRYYLYGSDAAKRSGVSDMVAMRVGLLADAALASWHDGSRLACLQDFLTVLEELNEFKPDDTLRTAHCHAVVRHVLLWFYQEATGEKLILDDGEAANIYPGCVSNPAPHAEIRDRYVIPIDMAWYMLAAVENHLVVDADITDNLERLLPNGPVLEGQLLLGSAKMHKALLRCDNDLFLSALRELIAYYSFVKANGGQMGLDYKNITYGTFPVPSQEQQEGFQELTEQFVLMYCAVCIFKGKFESIAALISELMDANEFSVRSVLLERLRCAGPAEDFYTYFAFLIYNHTQATPETQNTSPQQVFEIALKTLQIAQQTRRLGSVSDALLPWLLERWAYIWERQRFLLNLPSLYQEAINSAIHREKNTKLEKVIEVMTAILPTLGFGNQNQLAIILARMSSS